MLLDVELHYHIQKRPPLFPIVNQVSPVHMVTPYFIEACCGFIPPYFIYDTHLSSLSELTLETPMVTVHYLLYIDNTFIRTVCVMVLANNRDFFCKQL